MIGEKLTAAAEGQVRTYPRINLFNAIDRMR